MKKIYVCSALRGDIQENIRKACCYCAYIVGRFQYIPIAPHIYFTRFLNDDIIGEREFGISAGLLLLSECDELWYFGDRMTSGMTSEICYAIEHGILVKYIPQSDYEEYLEERSGDYEMQ